MVFSALGLLATTLDKTSSGLYYNFKFERLVGHFDKTKEYQASLQKTRSSFS